MSADIEKLAVFDSRIVQSRPKFAVCKGALSVTNAPFNAIAATQSQHTYNIYVPSENVYVDRGVDWTSTCYMYIDVTPNQALLPLSTVAQYGRDWALCALPLNSLCSTLTATINDTTSVINSQDVLKEVLRLTDYKKNRLQRTCPTMLDKYQSYNDCAGAINNPLGGIELASEFSETPNGAFYNVVYTTPTGESLPQTYVDGNAQYPAFSLNGTFAPYCGDQGVPLIPSLWSATYDYTGALPPAAPAGSGKIAVSGNRVWMAVTPVVGTPPAAPAWLPLKYTDGEGGDQLRVYFRWTSTEKLVLSPFTFSDSHQWDTGLFGINNIQLIMNMQSPSRIVRATSFYHRVISPAQFNTVPANSPFQNSRVNVQFLTPSLDVPLPPKSVVGYAEYPRYITTYQSGSIAPNDTVQIQSQTITLPQIPDLFIIYCKPAASSLTPDQGDWYLPVATSLDGVTNPLTINFDNFSGLLSSQTAEQLYQISVKNGLDLDWNTWAGMGHSGAPDALSGSNGGGGVKGTVGGGGRVPLVGGPLVLKPSQDITLQTGQSCSLVGNFTFQFNITVKNTSGVSQSGVQLYVITVNSGFFESIRGSSRIIKGVLSEQDIISAPLAAQPTHEMLHRHVGGKGMMASLANVLSKASDVYHHTKPTQHGMGTGAGMGCGTGAGAGAGTGAGTGGRRRKLSERLM